MRLTPVTRNFTSPTFASKKREQTFESANFKDTEKNTSVACSSGFSVLLGAAASGIVSNFMPKGSRFRSLIMISTGALVTLGTLALTLPSKLNYSKMNNANNQS